MKRTLIALIFLLNFSAKAQDRYHSCMLPTTSIAKMKQCVDDPANDFGYFILSLYPISANNWGLHFSAFRKDGSALTLLAPIKDNSEFVTLENYIRGSFIISKKFFQTYLDQNINIDLVPEQHDDDYDGSKKKIVHYRVKCTACFTPVDQPLNPSPPAGAN